MLSFRTIALCSSLALAIATSPAWAEAKKEKKENTGFFIGASGVGANINDFDFSNGNANGTQRTVVFETGTGGQARLGYDFGVFSLAVEGSYLEADIDSVSDATNGSGDIKVYSGMLVGTFSSELGRGFSPYLSLGVGAIGVEGDISYSGLSGNLETKKFGGVGPAGTAGIGLDYHFNNNFALSAGYQFIGTRSDEANESNLVGLHSLKAGLNITF